MLLSVLESKAAVVCEINSTVPNRVTYQFVSGDHLRLQTQVSRKKASHVTYAFAFVTLLRHAFDF
jgi:hypothetical protein